MIDANLKQECILFAPDISLNDHGTRLPVNSFPCKFYRAYEPTKTCPRSKICRSKGRAHTPIYRSLLLTLDHGVSSAISLGRMQLSCLRTGEQFEDRDRAASKHNARFDMSGKTNRVRANRPGDRFTFPYRFQFIGVYAKIEFLDFLSDRLESIFIQVHFASGIAPLFAMIIAYYTANTRSCCNIPSRKNSSGLYRLKREKSALLYDPQGQATNAPDPRALCTLNFLGVTGLSIRLLF